ncbi:Na-translocating system protein MpsC family protein [Cohnella sp. AR92]|uniref:Na-translocating system protein MpsC family protein n=1 Tax=Cohnella sp. AR92 TaxID=648716 RepID=UPI00131525CA|nr:Na-translocating system protein MpsC family protein [Cohnella sp. AR92]
MKSKEINAKELELSNFIARFYKDNIGKGPRNVEIKFTDNIMIYFVEGLLTPLEKSILQTNGGKEVVTSGRLLIVNNWKPKRLEAFEKIVEKKIVDEYISLDIDKDLAIGLVVLQK